MLKQDAMTPLYVQLMDTVEKDIKSGRYKPGDKIMTESEMAKTYGVSLITVRKAIGSLMEKGLVVRKQGKGTFVTKPKFSRNIKRLRASVRCVSRWESCRGHICWKIRLWMQMKRLRQGLELRRAVK